MMNEEEEGKGKAKKRPAAKGLTVVLPAALQPDSSKSKKLTAKSPKLETTPKVTWA